MFRLWIQGWELCVGGCWAISEDRALRKGVTGGVGGSRTDPGFPQPLEQAPVYLSEAEVATRSPWHVLSCTHCPSCRMVFPPSAVHLNQWEL